MDKTVLLSGQAFQASAYQCRFKALSSVMKNHQKLKQTLKEKPNLLSGGHQMLFGETVKIRQKSEELFKSINKGKSQLFRQAPQPQKTVMRRIINFSRRPGLDSRFAPASFPRQGSSGNQLIRKKELFSNMHSVIQGLFSQETLPKVILTGRSLHFLRN